MGFLEIFFEFLKIVEVLYVGFKIGVVYKKVNNEGFSDVGIWFLVCNNLGFFYENLGFLYELNEFKRWLIVCELECLV